MLKNTLIALLLLPSLAIAAPEKFEHVIYIGVDGLGAYGIPNAKTPAIDKLISNGALFSATGVMPSGSGPNWGSLLSGTRPQTSTITSNEWIPQDIGEQVLCGGEAGAMVPSIFRAFREHNKDFRLALFHDWPNIRRYAERDLPDVVAEGDDEDLTVDLLLPYLVQHKPHLTFVHLDHVDHVGHAIGHRTPAYYHAVEKADHLIDRIVKATQAAGIFEKTLFVITSDHGGVGKSHGGPSVDERTIPVVFSGNGIKRKIDSTDARNFDIPYTILEVMGIAQPACWEGKYLDVLAVL